MNSLNISDSAIKKLENYYWPGNVRELRHAIERAVILSENEFITHNDFHLKEKIHQKKQKSMNLESIEKNTIIEILKETNGNITLASKKLGLTRASLYRRIEKYGI